MKFHCLQTVFPHGGSFREFFTNGERRVSMAKKDTAEKKALDDYGIIFAKKGKGVYP